MNASALTLRDKRRFGRDVGRELVQKFGRKPYYTRIEIKRVTRRLNFPDLWDCWAYSLFMSHVEFDDHHAAIGVACDYAAMRGSMVDAMVGELPAGFDADLPWLDWPGFDLSSFFDAIDFS